MRLEKLIFIIGGTVLDNFPDIILTDNEFWFGRSVSDAGDVNNDGYSDVIVGSFTLSNVGKAYIFLGGENMDGIADLIITGEEYLDDFGVSVLRSR